MVMEKAPAEPTVKLVLFALVNAGAWFTGLTVNVKVWLTGAPTPLFAVMVRE